LPDKNLVVLGIPRGGVVVAGQVSRQLNAQLDVVLSRKIGAAGNPELAIGSVGEDGKLFLNEDLASRVGADKVYIETERFRQLEEIRSRIQRFRQTKEKVPLKDKIVIVTDDGVATGATMQAALWAVRQEKPKELIAAIPVGAKESVELLVDHADKVIVLRVPDYFAAISQFYLHFEQTSDSEVLQILKESVDIKGSSKGSIK